jgi:outer membrane protein OmpA-like peptidoglycan-associated protein
MKNKGLILAVTLIAVAAILVSGGTVMAAGGGHGGGHGGSHGGGRGGGHGHGSVSGSFWFGPGWGSWRGPGYPYYYPYYYPYDYWESPAVVLEQSPAYARPAPREEEEYYWYFCPDAKNYYPYVKRCPGGWLRVVPSQSPPDLRNVPQDYYPPPHSAPPPKVIDKITLKINFDTDKSNIRKSDEAELKMGIDFMKKYPGSRVRVEGHTDSVGTDKYNQKLSERRAEAVKYYFVQAGAVDASKITSAGYGETRPVASNKTEQGRAQNRRVEILILSD